MSTNAPELLQVAQTACMAAVQACKATVPAAAASAASGPQAAASALAASLGYMADSLTSYFLVLAMLGAFTMALVDGWKLITNQLPRFHRRAVLRWLREEQPPLLPSYQSAATLGGGHYGVARAMRATQPGAGPGYDSRLALSELLLLTTGLTPDPKMVDRAFRDDGGPLARQVGLALFELELSKMMSQVQEAADAALKNPDLFPNWFAFLVRSSRGAARPAGHQDDVQIWCDYLAAVHGQVSPAPPLDPKVAGEAFDRIRLLVKRQLDGFQIITSRRWREWNQFWAWLVGFVLLLVAQLAAPGYRDLMARLGGPVAMVVIALAGGFLAPVAKDIVTWLRKVKSGG